MPEIENLIETVSLTRRYGQMDVVKNLHLKVPAGSIYGFLGPNGAGKTTTIRMLVGLIHPTQGEISFWGHPVSRFSEVLKRVGAMVETPAFFNNLTGFENLEYLRRLRGCPAKRLPIVLEQASMSSAANRLYGQYSLGMKQRLGIAAALLDNPGLLILDEPANGLDPNGIYEIRNLIRKLAIEEGITIFLSSHQLNEVEQVATHVGIIQSGQLVFQGSLVDLRAHATPHIRVGVDDPGKAVFLLGDAYGEITSLEQELVINAPPEAAAEICQRLVSGGIRINFLIPLQESLETTFLQLTEIPDKHTVNQR